MRLMVGEAVFLFKTNLMNKATILQFVAALLFVLGATLLYLSLSATEGKTSVLGGVGPMIIGVGLFFLSKHKAIRG